MWSCSSRSRSPVPPRLIFGPATSLFALRVSLALELPQSHFDGLAFAQFEHHPKTAREFMKHRTFFKNESGGGILLWSHRWRIHSGIGRPIRLEGYGASARTRWGILLSLVAVATLCAPAVFAAQPILAWRPWHANRRKPLPIPPPVTNSAASAGTITPRALMPRRLRGSGHYQEGKYVSVGFDKLSGFKYGDRRRCSSRRTRGQGGGREIMSQIPAGVKALNEKEVAARASCCR